MINSRCLQALLFISACTSIFFLFTPSQTCVAKQMRIFYRTDSESEELSSLFEEDILDYSRCSSQESLRIFVHDCGHPLAEALSNHPAATKYQEEACLLIVFTNGTSSPLPESWYSLSEPGINHVMINLNDNVSIVSDGRELLVQASFHKGKFRSHLDISLSPGVQAFNKTTWKERPYLMPLKRANPYSLVVDVVDYSIKYRIPQVHCQGDCATSLRSSSFCFLIPSPSFHSRLLSALRAGCIPIVMSLAQPLPFQDHLDWTLASFRFPRAMMDSVPEKLEAMAKEDILEMRRRGKVFLSRFDDAQALAKSLVAALSERVQINLPLYPEVASELITPNDEFTNSSYSYTRIPSTSGIQTLASFNMYSRNRWNSGRDLTYTPRTVHDVPQMPGDAALFEGTKEHLVAVNGSARLGLTRDEEQFTVMILTYDRDLGVKKILERLRDCAYLNKVIIVWNNMERRPNGTWPEIHVPVEFILAERNSLLSRFLPYDRIETEAVVSMDDDTGVGQPELTFAFRMWRQNRERIVGFPERFHKFKNGKVMYGLSGTCEHSLVLTGFAFMHKEFLYEFSYNQPPAILEHIDKNRNCEDLAMNFLVAHLTRRPPLKVVKKVGMGNGSKSGLSARGNHYKNRDKCIQLFTAVYGYNPLLFTQEVARPNGNCVKGL